jgi:hypothetical protein
MATYNILIKPSNDSEYLNGVSDRPSDIFDYDSKREAESKIAEMKSLPYFLATGCTFQVVPKGYRVKY